MPALEVTLRNLHVFNIFGAYILDWKRSRTNSTEISAFQLGADGIVLFSYDFTATPGALNPAGDYLERVRRCGFNQVCLLILN